MRRLLRIEADGGDPRYGMFFANGGAARWLARYDAGRTGVLAALSLLLRTAARAHLGDSSTRALFEPFRAQIEVDGERSESSYTVTAAAGPRSEIPRSGPLGRPPRREALAQALARAVVLGMAASPPPEGEPRRFHWASSDASAARFTHEIPALALGRRRGRSRLRDALPEKLRMQTEEPVPYTVDGDLFPAARDISIEASPPLRFLIP